MVSDNDNSCNEMIVNEVNQDEVKTEVYDGHVYRQETYGCKRNITRDMEAGCSVY